MWAGTTWLHELPPQIAQAISAPFASRLHDFEVCPTIYEQASRWEYAQFHLGPHRMPLCLGRECEPALGTEMSILMASYESTMTLVLTRAFFSWSTQATSRTTSMRLGVRLCFLLLHYQAARRCSGPHPAMRRRDL